jgi:hypothetical protein
MAQSTSQSCQACKGGGKLPTPSGSQWQACPICGGSGEKYDPGLQYAYRMVPITIAGNGNSVQIISVLNADFRWQEFTGESTGPFTFLISDQSAGGRQFSNVAIHSAEMLGTGQNPFPLLTPYTFQKKGQIQIQLTDVSGSSNTVALCFIGTNINENVGVQPVAGGSSK